MKNIFKGILLFFGLMLCLSVNERAKDQAMTGDLMAYPREAGILLVELINGKTPLLSINTQAFKELWNDAVN